MSTRSTRALVLALALVVLTAGTGTASAASPAPPAAAPVTVTDANGNPVVISDASRVVSLGGAVTEVVYALGAQDQLVGVDVSSSYPPEALADKTKVGYYRVLTAEPVLGANPTLVIGTTDAGPAAAIDQDPRVRRHHAHPSRREHRGRCEGEDPGNRAGPRA